MTARGERRMFVQERNDGWAASQSHPTRDSVSSSNGGASTLTHPVDTDQKFGGKLGPSASCDVIRTSENFGIAMGEHPYSIGLGKAYVT